MTKTDASYFKNVLQNFDACLAPLAGVTDMAFRRICLENGSDLMVTEMVSAKGIMYNNKNTQALLMHDENEKNTGIQIFGSDTTALQYAVENTLNQTPFSFIDINMGCPVKKIVSNNEGSALLLDIPRLQQVAKTVKESSSKPVSVKIRTGYDSSHINCIDVAKALQDAGIDMITLHARTREDFYSGKADWDKIAQLKESVSIPVIANGDVNSVQDYINIKKHTNADGVMIGRAAMGNPFIFRQIREYNEHGSFKEIATEEKLSTAKKHFLYLLEYRQETFAAREFRKHLCWYTKGMHDSAKMRGIINSVKTKRELFELIDTLYEHNI